MEEDDQNQLYGQGDEDEHPGRTSNLERQILTDALQHWSTDKRIPLSERCELGFCKFLYIMPTFVSFGLFAYLSTFFVYCYFLPMYFGDYEKFLNLDNPWQSDEDKA